MSLKEVEVVVEFMAKIPTSNGNFETSKEALSFTGGNVNVINRSTVGIESNVSDALVVRDGEEVLAVFRVWNYWRKIK